VELYAGGKDQVPPFLEKTAVGCTGKKDRACSPCGEGSGPREVLPEKGSPVVFRRKKGEGDKALCNLDL